MIQIQILLNLKVLHLVQLRQNILQQNILQLYLVQLQQNILQRFLLKPHPLLCPHPLGRQFLRLRLRLRLCLCLRLRMRLWQTLPPKVGATPIIAM